MGIALRFNRTGPHSHLNKTKEEAEGTAAAAVVPASAQASSAANETTATFDLTHKRDKSNIIYQKLIKT
jgi:hypothetical protein